MIGKGTVLAAELAKSIVGDSETVLCLIPFNPACPVSVSEWLH